MTRALQYSPIQMSGGSMSLTDKLTNGQTEFPVSITGSQKNLKIATKKRLQKKVEKKMWPKKNAILLVFQYYEDVI